MLQNGVEEKLLAYIDEHQQELYEQLSALVQIDTVNHRTYGNENNGQDYLEKICREIGLTVDRFAPDSVEGLTANPDYMPGHNTDKRENLVATLPGEDTSRSIMLAAHMDTEYLLDESLWDDKPLSGVIKDGKIYGRGVGDDKCGLAVGWYLAKAFKECGITPKKNILIGSYIDEEGGGGNGALGLALKYPVDCCINLDAASFEMQALGGGCFKLELRSTKNDVGIASVFEVFEGVRLIVDKLAELGKVGKNFIRLAYAGAGKDGSKTGEISLAIYTDMTKEESQAAFDGICASLGPQFDALGLTTDGFKLFTLYFIYGETDKDSPEAKLLSEIIKEETGAYPNTTGTCLSDLSLLLRYGCKNSFNYGFPRGSNGLGNAHQPNEHILCENLLEFTKRVAKILAGM